MKFKNSTTINVEKQFPILNLEYEMSNLKLIKFETAQLLAHLYYENIEKYETSSEALLDAQIANVEIMLKNTQHLLDYLKNKRPKLTMLEIALIIYACDAMNEKNDIFHFD